MNEASRVVAVFGRLDEIGPDGMARGWCWSPQDPRAHRTIRLVGDGMTLANALCDRPRDDLSQLGIRHGSFGFETRLDRGLFGPSPGRVTLTLQDDQTGRTIGAPVDYAYPALSVREAGAIRAYFDRVDDEGLLNGWAWNSSEPERRVRLRFLVNGAAVGSTTANKFRGDLQAAKIGDGNHAFSFLLPWTAISETSVSHVTLLDDATGAQLNASTVFRRPALRPIEDRLRDAERSVRLLAARVGELEQRGLRNAASSRAMLGVIGDFFTRLAGLDPEEVPTALVPSLSGLLDGVADRLPPFALAVPTLPTATLCFAACGSLEGLYAALAAVHAAGIDASASVAVLDDGGLAEAALLPSLVQNLRYSRLQPGQTVVQARNRLTRLAGEGAVVFLSPAVRLEQGWVTAALDLFQRYPDCGVIGSRIVREDGTISTFGLLPDRNGQLCDPAAAEDADHPRFNYVQPVAAVLDRAVVIRASVWEALGGFDESFTDQAAAVVEFCLRCWQAGHSVLAMPTPAPRWSPGWLDDGDTQPDPDLLGMLTRRWSDWAPPDWAGTVGRALLVGPPGEGAGLLGAASALRRNGWHVSAIAPGWDGADAAGRAMRLDGIEVVHSPFQPSVAAALADPAGAFDLVQIDSAAAAAMPAARVRELAPGAKVIVVMNETDLPLTPERLAAAAATDLTLAGAQPVLHALQDANVTHAFLPLFRRRPRMSERDGLVLWAANGVDDADVAWFMRSVWPAIRRQQPGLRLTRQSVTTSPGTSPGLPVSSELGRAWAAVSPRRNGDVEETVTGWCREAEVPLIAMRATLSSDAKQGVISVEATSSAVANALMRLARDPAAWLAAASPEPHGPATQDELAEHYAQALSLLGLPFKRPLARA